jgi:transcriptional antiterminator NusG
MQKERLEGLEPGATESEGENQDADALLSAEERARRLFASYLEPPAEEAKAEKGRETGSGDLQIEDKVVLSLFGDDEEAGDTEPSDEEASEGGRNWFVVHSYSGYENKVKKNLEHRIESLAMQDKIFEVVVPTEEEIELKDGQRRTVERRIFPGYILVDMVMDEDSWYVVRNTPGVTGFVGSVRKPTPLRKRDVDRILKRMRAETPKVKVTFRPGQKVRICDGPFEDFVGSVDEISPEKGKVRILVSFFGRETPVELDFLQVEKI